MKTVKPKPPRSAEVVDIIRVVSLIGCGVDNDPVRELYQYWSTDGILLAQKDMLDELEAK